MLSAATSSKSKKPEITKTPMTEHELNQRANRILIKVQEGLNVQHSFHRVLLDGKKRLECYLQKAGTNSDNEEMDEREENKDDGAKKVEEKSEMDEEINGGSDIDETDTDFQEMGDEGVYDEDTGLEDEESYDGDSDDEESYNGDSDDAESNDEPNEKNKANEVAAKKRNGNGPKKQPKTPEEIRKADEEVAKANKFIKEAQSGKYIKTYIAKIKNFLASDKSVGVIHLGYTTRKQAMTLFDEKPVVLLALNEDLVGYVLTHQDSRQPVHSCQFQFKAIKTLLERFKNQSKPRKNMEKSHSNAFPDKVEEGSERLYNLSIFNMSGHTTTDLKFSKNAWKGKLACHMDLGEKEVSCTALGYVTEYGSSTLQTPALVDELNAAFFPDSVKRKKQVAYLINEHQKQVTSRLAENGGYMLRYIARNMLNPKHRDKKDCTVIPSTLLYGGKFHANASFLKLSDHDISIPICVGTIISFFAAKIDHEVEVDPDFIKSDKKFVERVVEVFGSYESIYQHLKTK
ncbi:hypothetical protein HDU78_009967 [Chytriomyces hyalinus]|nr:hypothetical protein HDU78_009967 [Chytriomyces hyalinus]